MSLKKRILMLLCFILTMGIGGLHSNPDAPPSRTQLPMIPGFLNSIDFVTVESDIFSELSRGMLSDPFTNMSLNPALISGQKKSIFYLDLSPNEKPGIPSVDTGINHSAYYLSYSDSCILPNWHYYSTINRLDSSPQYNIAAIIPLGDRLSVGLVNRSIFSYGAYLTDQYRPWGDRGAMDGNYSSELDSFDPNREDMIQNQQSLFGTQLELSLAYQLNSRLSLGLQLGHLQFKRRGSFLDTNDARYPHSTIDMQEEEQYRGDGDHMRFGFGASYKFSNKTQFSGYLGFTNGDSQESIQSTEFSEHWYEQAMDTQIYQNDQYSAARQEVHSGDGNHLNLTFTLDHQFSESLRIRSILRYSRFRVDGNSRIESSNSIDIEYSHWYHEHYYDSGLHLRKYIGNGDRMDQLSGKLDQTDRGINWFNSLRYQPNKNWTFYCGLYLGNRRFDRNIVEYSQYSSDYQGQYSLYRPQSMRYLDGFQKEYQRADFVDRWIFHLPLGIKARIYKSLYLYLGTDLTYTLTRRDTSVDISYPSMYYQYYQDDVLMVDDNDDNRTEDFREYPPKKLDRYIGKRFGLVYAFSNGFRLFFRSYGEMFKSDNWAFGCQFGF